MDEINEFIQGIKLINWFNHDHSENNYYVISSVFEAYDKWNKKMLETWESHIYSLENIAIEKLGDEQIDLIFATISSEIADKIYENWNDFITENHLENEIGLENEMLDMVKRDVSWACVERVLNIQGFFTILLNIYSNGYFPCSWIGDYQNGQVVVL